MGNADLLVESLFWTLFFGLCRLHCIFLIFSTLGPPSPIIHLAPDTAANIDGSSPAEVVSKATEVAKITKSPIAEPARRTKSLLTHARHNVSWIPPSPVDPLFHRHVPGNVPLLAHGAGPGDRLAIDGRRAAGTRPDALAAVLDCLYASPVTGASVGLICAGVKGIKRRSGGGDDGTESVGGLLSLQIPTRREIRQESRRGAFVSSDG
jgi:hypothetical protein